MPIIPKFPEPGTYCRFYDLTEKVYKYLRLLEVEAPLKYPYRFASLSAGSKRSEAFVFDELNPSDAKKHRFCAYIGVKPGVKLFIWHPYDQKVLKWDEDIEDVSDDDVANIEYEESPYDAPQKSIWIEHDRYPGVLPKNVSNKAMCPEIIFIAAKYLVKEHRELSVETIGKLEEGVIPSIPITFGGLI